MTLPLNMRKNTFGVKTIFMIVFIALSNKVLMGQVKKAHIPEIGIRFSMVNYSNDILGVSTNLQLANYKGLEFCIGPAILNEKSENYVGLNTTLAGNIKICNTSFLQSKVEVGMQFFKNSKDLNKSNFLILPGYGMVLNYKHYCVESVMGFGLNAISEEYLGFLKLSVSYKHRRQK
jgi:hypothetical protein